MEDEAYRLYKDRMPKAEVHRREGDGRIRVMTGLEYGDDGTVSVLSGGLFGGTSGSNDSSHVKGSVNPIREPEARR